LLTGALVFEADNLFALVARHIEEKPVPPSHRTELEIPADLEEVVMDCLRKKPDERPSSAEELTDRLSSCEVGAWTNEDAKRWWQLRFADGDGAHPGTSGARA